MAQLSTAIFATQPRPNGNGEVLLAHAILLLGSKPYWEIHISNKIFRFIPDPQHMLEDGLWQLNTYCQIPEAAYKHDPSNVAPLTLEEEFGAETCNLARKELSDDLNKTGIQFKIIEWADDEKTKNRNIIESLIKNGVSISR